MEQVNLGHSVKDIPVPKKKIYETVVATGKYRLQNPLKFWLNHWASSVSVWFSRNSWDRRELAGGVSDWDWDLQ